MKRKQFLKELVKLSNIAHGKDLEALSYDELFKLSLTIADNRMSILVKAIFNTKG